MRDLIPKIIFMRLKEGDFHIAVSNYENTSIGECIEVPVIVEGKTTEEIMNKMIEGIKGYCVVFPR